MVGKDGWAVPLGRAPDHHVQKAVRRLNVMFLEGRDHAGRSWAALTPGSSGERGWQPPGLAGVGHPSLTAPSGRQRGAIRWSTLPQGHSAQGQCELIRVGKFWSFLQRSQGGELPRPGPVAHSPAGSREARPPISLGSSASPGRPALIHSSSTRNPSRAAAACCCRLASALVTGPTLTRPSLPCPHLPWNQSSFPDRKGTDSGGRKQLLGD